MFANDHSNCGLDASPDFEKALRRCAMDCDDPDECVVLTGHSQGTCEWLILRSLKTDRHAKSRNALFHTCN